MRDPRTMLLIPKFEVLILQEQNTLARIMVPVDAPGMTVLELRERRKVQFRLKSTTFCNTPVLVDQDLQKLFATNFAPGLMSTHKKKRSRASSTTHKQKDIPSSSSQSSLFHKARLKTHIAIPPARSE